ncbi:MAG: hypothetical protein K2Y28_07905 [Burkholderiaceae bacterium]|nr:hypothetical protein [Burkholderiaceae bacterium]
MTLLICASPYGVRLGFVDLIALHANVANKNMEALIKLLRDQILYL